MECRLRHQGVDEVYSSDSALMPVSGLRYSFNGEKSAASQPIAKSVEPGGMCLQRAYREDLPRSARTDGSI